MNCGTSYTFECGCTFPVVGPPPTEGALPLLDISLDDIPEDCPATWDLLGRGLTKGVFQLENPFVGKKWAKRLKPTCMEHLVALGSALRPGCLNAKSEDGVSMTEHYCRRKNGEEEVPPFHPAVDVHLADTYGIVLFQEQLLLIARDVANFDLAEQERFRKSVSKKDEKLLSEVGKFFISKAEAFGVITREQAEHLWNIFKSSGRYIFNRAHSACYAILGYQTAYAKAHSQTGFFTSKLKHARGDSNPREEMAELVEDAKLFDVDVLTPNLCNPEMNFLTDGLHIRFGVNGVKGVGESVAYKLAETLAGLKKDFGKELGELSRWEFVSNAERFPLGIMSRLVRAGALDWLGVSRRLLNEELKVWHELTDVERKWIRAHPELAELVAALHAVAKTKKQGGGCATEKRASLVRSYAMLLEKPPSPLVDSPLQTAADEEELLGVSLSTNATVAFDLSAANCSCKEFLCGKADPILLGVEVREVRETTTKTGKNPGQKMGILTVSDGTCTLSDVVVFPDAWAEFGKLFAQGTVVLVQGERDRRGKNSSSLFVSRAWPAKGSISQT
jgi:DNA polymerase-3 subunit alpha